MSATGILSRYIRVHGPIKTARVSTAQCGSGCPWKYWGAVRYEIRLRRDGVPSHFALERASRDRRSVAGAERDCEAMCDHEDRIEMQCGQGRLSEADCRYILSHLATGDPLVAAATQVHHARLRRTQVCLTLSQRLLVRRLVRAGWTPERAAEEVLATRAIVQGRWVVIAGSGRRVAYIAYGDDRDAAAFAAEPNQESRRLILAACGDRVLPPAELVQMDDYGRLMREWDGRVSVHVICPSTGAKYVLPVSARCRSAKEAVAETFGLSAAEYEPTIQS